MTVNVKNKKPEFVKTNKIENVDEKQKKQNRNGKLGINKNNNYVYVPNAPRKRCEKCHSSNHITYVCKNTDVCGNKEPKLFYDPYVPLKHWGNPFCDNLDCMPCKMNVITGSFNLRRKFLYNCISQNTLIHSDNSQSSRSSQVK